jgi:hypothetical protein
MASCDGAVSFRFELKSLILVGFIAVQSSDWMLWRLILC